METILKVAHAIFVVAAAAGLTVFMLCTLGDASNIDATVPFRPVIGMVWTLLFTIACCLCFVACDKFGRMLGYQPDDWPTA